ncbi:MAG: LuxR C-terminal-related transcriptional regulator [Cyclobacteriaceae bacterium]|nr:LuxR C-terminal-related transcriptional regulator [Cyclobacteriaceae bacterium]
MRKTYNHIDLAKAFGKQDYIIYEKDYQERLIKKLNETSLWAAGKCFSLIGNTHTWQTEMVTGKCFDVTGYEKEEVLALHAQFVPSFIVPEDFPFVLEITKAGMEYLHQLPAEQRPFMHVTYFVRARHKNGQTVIIQNQSIPLAFDEQNVPFIFGNIISDISYLNPTNIPFALVVNRFTNEQLHLDPVKLQLKKHDTIFTPREKELITYLIKGYTSRQAAESLNVSYETIRTHRKNILQKADVRNTSQLLRYVLMNEQLLGG